MSEEFKSIRITLSEEAFSRLEEIMKNASFRSYSSTIEECIRVVSDVISEIHLIAGKRGAPDVSMTDRDCAQSFLRILLMMYRFTERRPLPHKDK